MRTTCLGECLRNAASSASSVSTRHLLRLLFSACWLCKVRSEAGLPYVTGKSPRWWHVLAKHIQVLCYTAGNNLRLLENQQAWVRYIYRSICITVKHQGASKSKEEKIFIKIDEEMIHKEMTIITRRPETIFLSTVHKEMIGTLLISTSFNWLC